MMAVKLEILEGQEDELQLMAAEAEATLTATKALLGHRASATGALVEEALVANLEEVVRAYVCSLVSMSAYERASVSVSIMSAPCQCHVSGMTMLHTRDVCALSVPC